MGTLFPADGDPNRPPNAPLIESKSKSKSTEDIALNDAERLTRIASPRKKVPQAEKEFLKDVTEVMGKWRPAAAEAELENWGGWWRNRHRQNADKARRVLAEIGALVKEGRVDKSPGAAAVDLWKRLP